MLEKAFRDTISWEKPRNLDSLPDYLEQFSERGHEKKGLAWAPTAKGTPHTIVLTGAGIRAADLTRYLNASHDAIGRMLDTDTQ